MFHRVTILATAVIALALLVQSVPADTSAFTITDDSTLNQKIASARSKFLAIKPYLTRLDATILVPGSNGTWKRGSYNPNTVAYPASCVKLPYLAAAMYWSRTNNKPYDYLDWCLRPMIVDSDNYKTGDTVDQITGAPNYSTSTYDSTFWAWYDKRLYTENFLNARGLLENQTIIHKTYPTNSGSSPSGAELLAKDYRGGNLMQPKCSASLMLEVIKGAIEPDANAYMREMLTSYDLWGGRSEFGFGLPPGTLYQNKLGLAYDTLEDIAYIQLPNGQEFFLAAYSNGFQGPEPGQPYPYDASLLGGFAEILIEELGFHVGCPPKIKIDNIDSAVTITGSWNVVTDKSVDYDMYGDSYLSTTTNRTETARVTWNLNPPATGKYEVCVFSPQKSTATTISYTVVHAGGSTNVSVNQTKCGGRWYKLGDFNFNAGQGSVYITNKASGGSKTVMADAVKITQWPSADPTPSPTPTLTPTESPSPTPTATPGDIPAAPSNLTAVAVSKSQINLAWQDNSSNEDNFVIERKTGTGSFSVIATVAANTTTFNNTGLNKNTTYTYRVKAVNASGESAYSNEASAKTPVK